MKSVEIDPAIEANPLLLSSVRRAQELLEMESTRSSNTVSATWKLVRDDRNAQFIRLAIADWSGRAETTFSPETHKNHDQVRGRMIRLWGDLLQIRSHKLVEEMQAAASVTEEN